MLETQCLTTPELMAFIAKVAEWFTINFTEGTATFSTGKGIFTWLYSGSGLYCYAGQLS